jgi:hypothetical protein
VLPVGSISGNFGYVIGFPTIILSLLLILIFVKTIGWFIVISYLTCFKFSFIIVIFVERILYEKPWMIDKLEIHAKHCVAEFGDNAPLYWEKIVPSWWLNMMSKKWEKSYIEKLSEIIYTLNPADPLFSINEYKKRFDIHNKHSNV